MLEGGLLKTQRALKFGGPSLKEKVFLQVMVDLIMSQLPLLGEDLIVCQNGLFNLVGGTQNLLLILLSIHLDPSDLGTIGSPLLFGTIRLWERIS